MVGVRTILPDPTAEFERAVGRAQAASQSNIAGFLLDREEIIVNRLVQDYRSKKLSPQDALARVGVISELRSIRSSVERAIIEGERAVSAVMEQSNAQG